MWIFNQTLVAMKKTTIYLFATDKGVQVWGPKSMELRVAHLRLRDHLEQIDYNALEDAGLECISFPGIDPLPTLWDMYEAALIIHEAPGVDRETAESLAIRSAIRKCRRRFPFIRNALVQLGLSNEFLNTQIGEVLRGKAADMADASGRAADARKQARNARRNLRRTKANGANRKRAD